MKINFLDNLIEDDVDEIIEVDPIRGNLYPGESLHFQYDKERLMNINYVRKDIF
jgi:hypothetical protein